MFGLLKGSGCKLDPLERQAWLGHLCGVCLALRDDYGQLTRFFANYDAALLSALCEAQEPLPQTRYRSRCPLRRHFAADIVSPNAPGARYAASVALVMAATRIQDHLADGETFLCRIPGLASRITTRWIQRARVMASEQGFDMGNIVLQTRLQPAVEARAGQDFFYYARPTELAVGAVFQHTAFIANRPQNAGLLFEMGRLFGQIMYLLDGYLDMATDQLNGRFNPLLACFRAKDRRSEAWQIFQQAYRKLNTNFDQLALTQPNLAGKLLSYHLQDRGLKVLAICPSVTNIGSVSAASNQTLGQVHLSEGFDFEDELEEEDEFESKELKPHRAPWWEDLIFWSYCCEGCDFVYCEDGGCGDFDCGNLDCGDLDCGDFDCGDVDCGGADCSGGDCSGMDCGGADCGGADCS